MGCATSTSPICGVIYHLYGASYKSKFSRYVYGDEGDKTGHFKLFPKFWTVSP